MRWIICALALAACTGESGGNRMMIDAPVGTGGIGGSAGGAGAIGGTGGGNPGEGCSSTCSAPSSQSVCITGTVHRFVNPSIVAGPTAQSNLVVKIYDPIQFVTNPGTAPAATVNVEQLGCFIADGIPRFSSGLAAVVTDNAPGTGVGYVPMAVPAIVQANRNVDGLQAFFVEGLTLAMWQSQTGNPPGCPQGFMGCGMYLAEYLDVNGCPVANLQPIRPNGNPQPSNVFCFGADRLTLTTNDVTSNVGICAISPDVFEPHTGGCAAGGCTCCGNACAPTFGTSLGGSASGIIFFQTFVATQ